MLISHWLKSLRNRLHRPVRARVSKKRRTQRVAPKNLTASVESLEDRLLLTLQLISIFPNAGVTQPEDTGGLLQQNEVLEVAPRELIFRFNPGQSLDPATLDNGIQVFRSGFDGDFTNGSVPVAIGSLEIGEQPNEAVLRFANTLPDDQYRIVLKGSGSNPLRNTLGEAFNNGVDLNYHFEVDVGAQIEAVVHEPVVRAQVLTVTSTTNLTDGVTFTVRAGGKPITFEFDSNGTNSANGDDVFAIDISGATTTAQYAFRIATALTNAANDLGPAFGLDVNPGAGSSIILSANAETAFSPVITRPVNAMGATVTGLTVADGAIEQRENFINVYFNANDPLNAVGRDTLVIPDAAANGTFVIDDGDQLTIDNGGGPVTLTMDSGPAGRFNVSTAADAVIRDGDFLELNGQRFEFTTGPVLQVTATTLAGMTIGGTFTLTDNLANSRTFEFTNNNPAMAGRVAINLNGVSNRADIENRIVAAINGQTAVNFRITATSLNNGLGRITLQNDSNVVVAAQTGFTQAGTYGVTAGATAVVVEENFTSEQLAQAISNVVNGTANRGFSGGLVNFPTFTNITNASFANPAVFMNLNLTGNSGPQVVDYYVGQNSAQIAKAIATAINSLGGFTATARSGVVQDGWVVQVEDGEFTIPLNSPFATFSEANPTNVESPAFYQLFNTDGTLRLPDQVIYNADAGVATLRFNAPLGNGTYNLRIGETFEATNTLATTVNLGTLFGTRLITVNDFIGGDPTESDLDVNDIDLYRIQILTSTSATGISLTLSTSNGLSGTVRLFNASGVQIGIFSANDGGGTVTFNSGALGPGVYFIGVSSQGNQSYSALDGSGATGGTSTGSYRLTINPNVSGVSTSDNNTSFGTATNLGNLGTSGQVISAQIQAQSNGATNLQLPLEPGGNDEPGHRDIPINGENHISNSGIGRGTDFSFPNGIPTIAYTFDLANPYGTDPQGNSLFNAITPEQMQRTREIFELYSYITGVQFVEAESRAEAAGQGLSVFTIVTGDLRALDPTVPTGPGGVGGIAGGGLAIMDAGENFTAQDNLYGASWFGIAMHEIGHLLGLGHAYDLPAIMGDGVSGEPVFPSDHDIVHMRRLFRRDSNDIDLYQFQVTETGTVTIETIAERLTGGGDASQLNTVLRLYRQEQDGTRTLIAQNDDYYGNDSFLSLRLTEGTYFVGVSSVGNENYDPRVTNSGSVGITDGQYELRLDLRPDLEPIPDDLASIDPLDVSAKGRSALRDTDDSLQFDGDIRKATAIDGDADGKAGGQFSFSFQVGETIFVDKSAGSYANAMDPLGSITNPYREIDQALIAAQALRLTLDSASPPDPTPVIVRIIGNSGADGQLGTLADNNAYLIGINDNPVNPQVLVDGATLEVPMDINVVIDAGAVLKLNRANVDAGSSAQGIDRSGGSVQVLGTTFNNVVFTSYRDDSIGGDSDGVSPGANPGDWGGLVFREDSDYDFEYSDSQTQRNIFASNNPFIYTFTGFPVPASDATLNFLGFGDFGAVGENLTVDFLDSMGAVISGVGPFLVFNFSSTDATSIRDSFTLTRDQLALVSADGQIRVRVRAANGGTEATRVDDLNVVESLRVDLSVGTAVPIFLNTVNHATVLYGGGPVVVDSVSRDFDSVHIVNTRPTVSYNTIALGANAAISGSPNSFNDSFEDPRRFDHHLDRLGPDIHGNTVVSNEINGVRIRTRLSDDLPLDRLQVSARLTATDIVYVISENLIVDGGVGGLIINPGDDPDITSDDVITKRTPGRLMIDPGAIVKVGGARIEMERGGSNLIAEGTPEDPIIFTSINDDTFGAGGSFDTNNDSLPPVVPPIGSSTMGTLALGNGGGSTNSFSEDPPAAGGVLSAAVINAANATFRGADGVGKDGPLAKLGWHLNLLYHDHEAFVASGAGGDFTPKQNYLTVVDENVLVELSAATGNAANLRAAILAAGYQIIAQAGTLFSVLLPIASLDDLVNLQHARVINPVYGPMRNVGSTTSQADVSMNADDARMQFNVDGSGITVGVLSDSFNTSGLGNYASDIASGDLPGPGNPFGNSAAINVLQDLASGSDEGRAMLQLIHDVAPGANLQFATAFAGQASFAANIRALRDAGSNVIVDDVGYANEPFFQDGVISQAVDEVVGDGVAYFSSAGNSARDSYESTFVSSGVAGPGGVGIRHDFDPSAGVDTLQQITVDPFATARITFQWDQPFGSLGGAASASDLDILFFDSNGNLLTGGNVLQGQDPNVGADAFEFAGIVNLSAAPLVVNVAIVHNSGPLPSVIKYINFGGGFTIDEFQTNSSTAFGHPNALGAQGVGAAFYFETPEFGTAPPLLESFSSAGGLPIFFDTAGNRLVMPDIRQTPSITAPDGTNTTFFGGDVEGDGFPNFFGTSAAAPHAAAVAALMLEAGGGGSSLTPAQIRSIMQNTATNIGPAGFDNDSGFGLINALPAVFQSLSAGGPVGQQPMAGDWGGFLFNAVSGGNLDYVQVHYAGGISPIEGGFAAFNPVEIIQADVRISNSIFQDNADGRDSGTTDNNRVGRGANDDATIFVRGAQPVIVNNIFDSNEGNVISINANAMQAVVFDDPGRATGPIFSTPLFGSDDPNLTTEYANNFGPLVRNNRMADNGFNGMTVRGGLLTTETIWDDTDIVHILRDEIVVPNLHTFGGLRLQSSGRESLVVKLDGPNAGFTASGEEIDIDDRVGGTLEIVGTPGRPVILTSLYDNSVGAGFQPDGTPLRDTVDPTVRQAAPGDWRSVRLDQFSNDRNVAVYNERERPTRLDFDVNNIPNIEPNGAEFLGSLAPSLAAADDNRRAGFEIHGFINTDDSTDQDVYSFTGTAGTEVWFDIDRTAGALDTVLELISANGQTVLARSDNTQDEQNNTALIDGIGLPMRKDDRLGEDFYSTNPKDAGMRVVLPGTAGTSNTYFIRVRSNGPSVQAAAPNAPGTADGQTSGEYQLQIRLRQRDEHPGSTVTFSQIRFATDGIEIFGQPGHSPFVGEAGEGAGVNDNPGAADNLGNLLDSDLNTFSVAGNLGPTLNDLDFYQFNITYTDIQQIAGVNSPADVSNGFATIFDLDYADGLARANASLYIFNAQGQLILVGNDSNIAEDQPGPLNGNDLTDPSRGTVGKLDPFIGSIELPEGTYFAVVTANANLPQVLDQYVSANSISSLTRLEPVDSLTRIAEDHIGSQGGMTFQTTGLTQLIDTSNPSVSLTSSIVPWHLGDVSLFVSTGSNSTTYYTVDPFTGAQETRLNNTGTLVRDIAIRRRMDRNGGNDYTGDLVGFQYSNTRDDVGNFLMIDSGNGTTISSTPDGITTFTLDNNGNPVADDDGLQINAVTYSDGTTTGFESGTNTMVYAVGTQFGDLGGGAVRNILYRYSLNGVATSAPSGNRNAAGAVGSATDTDIVERGILDTGGSTITGLAVIGTTMYAVTDAGQLFQVNSPTGGATVTMLSANIGGLGLNFQGLSAGPPNVQGNAYRNTLFAITDTGDIYAFDTTGALQPIFADGEVFVSTGLTAVTGLAFSNLDRTLWEANSERDTDAGHGFTSLFNDPIHGDDYDRSQEGGTALYFGNNYANGNGENSYGGLAGGAHGSIETNAFTLAGYSGTDLPMLYFNYFLESQPRDVLLSNPAQMLDSMRIHIWDSSTGQWDLLTTNNGQRSTVDQDEYDYQLPPGVAEDRFIQEGFNFAQDAGQWRQIRVNLSPYAGLSDLRLRFDFSSDGSMNLGDIFTTGTEIRAKAGNRLQDGQTFQIDQDGDPLTNDFVTFEFDLGFTVNVPSGANFSDRTTGADTVTVRDILGNTRVFEFDNDGIQRVPGSILVSFTPTTTAATMATRLRNAINAAGLVGVTAITDGDRVNITANGAGAPFNVTVSSAAAGLRLDPFDGAGVTPGNVRVIVNANMTSTQVAAVMRQAIADTFDVNAIGPGTGDVDLFPVYKDVVRVIGHDVGTQARVRTGGDLEIAEALEGDEFGRFYQDEGLNQQQSTTRRLANYNFEGLYIDDIIIGFASQGEITTGAPTGTTNFIANAYSFPDDIDVGNYQLEIRRGTEYALASSTFHSQTGTLDPNDRLSNKITVTIPDGSLLFDGQKFQLSDGINTATFEFANLDLVVGDANFGIAPGTAQLPNFAVGFRATESSSVIAARLRDLLNSTAVRNHLRITAATADGSVTGNVGTSSEVNLFGAIAANTRGDVSSSFNILGTLTFQIFSRPNDEYVFTGDQNLNRLQGSIQISQNFIFDTENVGIKVDDDLRRVGDNPVIGVHRSLPTVTPNERLTRGVALVNNVIAHFGDAGIELNGDNNSGPGPLAAVPFHRLINNTIFGGLAQTGDGVRITNNSAPTLLNNIIANTQRAIFADASSSGRTIVSRSSYQNNGTNGINGTNAQLLFAGEPLFVDPTTNNFYLAAGARPIDSARNQFEDRVSIVQTGASIGIPQSNLFAPLFDAYGQFRTNDESTPNTGEGNPPFFDRGAIEREDVTGPTARLISPEDNDGAGFDLDPDNTEVFLENAVIRQFIVGLDDVGIGIDDTSVNTTNVQLSFNGNLLTEGVDYLLRYNTNTKQIVLEAASGVFAFGAYRINLINQNGIRDLAGNNLAANRQPSGTTAFDITIAPPPVITVAPVTVIEGDLGTTFADFIVTLSGPTRLGVTVDVQTADGTATSAPGPGQDYVAVPLTQLMFDINNDPNLDGDNNPLTQRVRVTVNGDVLVEGDETFFLNLSNVTNATIDPSSFSVLGTINDDDLLIRLTPATQTQLEGDTGTSNMTFTVALFAKDAMGNPTIPAPPRPFDVTVTYTTSDGTALAGQDYTATTGTVTILGGDNSATFTVPIIGDVIQEVPVLEDFTVTLSNPINAGIQTGFGTVTGTIQDDDPKFSVGNAVVLEGDSGNRQILFTVSISSPVVAPVTIDFATQNGTALAGSDYVATNGTLTFDPALDPNLDGDNDPLTQQVIVNVIGDTSPEGNQTFNLVLSNPSAGGIAPGMGTGVGTIIDDDPRISINDVQIVEGNSGTTNAVFTVTLSQPATTNVTVDFTTSLGNGVAAPPVGQVFEREPNDTINSAEALDSRAFITTPNANITDAQGNPVALPHVTVLGRGNGTFDFFSFTGSAGDRIVLDIDGATFDSRLFLFDSAGNVVASNDDGFVNGGPNGNALDAGSTSTEDAFLELVLAADGLYTIGVGRFDSVASPTGLTAGASGRSIEKGDQYNLHISIENFDPPIPGTVIEVEPNNTFAAPQNVDGENFTNANNPNINNQTGMNVSTMMPYVIVNGTGDFSPDFYSFTATAGQTGIFDIDGTSGFDSFLSVFRPDGSLLASNDDNPTGPDTGSVSGLDSFIQVVFPVTGVYRIQVTELSSPFVPSGETYTLNMAIGGHALGSGTAIGGPVLPDGSANPTSDFNPAGTPSSGTAGNPGTLIIPAGMTTGTITIAINGDNVNELDENFFVRLANAVGAVIDDGTGEGTIINDDAPIISISTPNPTPETGSLGTPNVVNFTVTLSRPADVVTTIDFATANGTAISGLDYVAQNGTLTFQIGEQAKQISIQLIKDGQRDEGNENFFVNLSNPIGADFSMSDPNFIPNGPGEADDQLRGTGTIIDNTGFLERVLTVVAPDAGRPGQVRVIDSSTGNVRLEITPYPGFMGGIRIATGDVNNDGTPDIITAPGPGGGPHIKVFSGTNGAEILSFFAFDPMFFSGVYVASGDFGEAGFPLGDSFDDIVVSADAGGGPRVSVFSSATGPANNRQFAPAGIQNRMLYNFFVYDPGFVGGVRVAAGDVTGDGTDDLVVGAGFGGGPHVQVFDGRSRSTTSVRSFYAYNSGYTGGIYVAVGDVDLNTPASGRAAEIITGPGGPGLGPLVRVFNVVNNAPGVQPLMLAEFLAYGSAFQGGVRVSAGDVNGDTFIDVITAPGRGGGPHVRGFDGETLAGRTVSNPPTEIAGLFPYEANFTGGLFVAGVVDVELGQPLRASEINPSVDAPALTQEDVDAAVKAALARLQAAGVSEEDIDELSQLYVTVANLEGDLVALARKSSIVLDVDAAGNGWFIDPTPYLDEEFVAGSNGLSAVNVSALGRTDLLTVVMHELGHKLGLSDLESQLHPDALMSATLPTGTRRLFGEDELDEAFTDGSLFDSLLLD